MTVDVENDNSDDDSDAKDDGVNDYVVIDDDDNGELFTNKGREVRTKPNMSLV